MAKLTLEEKKLEKIRLQLFGKEQPAVKKSKTTSASSEVKVGTSAPTSSIHSSDTIFLRQDLTKVFLVSAFLIGGQFLLYFLSLQEIINLNVFHIF